MILDNIIVILSAALGKGYSVPVSLCAADGAAMTRDQPTFDDLIAEAHRAVALLDEFTMRHSAKATARAVRDSKSVYARL